MSIQKTKLRSRYVLPWWAAVVAVSGVVVGGVVSGVQAAWQDPTCDPNTNPDTCNAAAPVNVSSVSQTKNGPLNITVNTGVNALTINSGPTGSPSALFINSSGGGTGVNISNSATTSALNVNSIGANTAVNINQNQNGGTGVNVSVGGTSGGNAVVGTSTSGGTGSGVYGTGSLAGVTGNGSGNGSGVLAKSSGSGTGVYAAVGSGGTGYAGFFDGTNSQLALGTSNGRVTMTSSLTSFPTLAVANDSSGSVGSAITADNASSGAASIYATAKNNFAVSANTSAYNFGGVVGCYTTVNCGVLGSGAYAGYFDGQVLIEDSLRVKSIAAAQSLQETHIQGQYSDNSPTTLAINSVTSPYALESTGEYVFVCNNTTPEEVHKLRPSDGKLVGIGYLVPGFYCTDLLFDGTYLWISSDGVSTGVTRLNPYDLTYIFLPIASQIRGLAFDGGNVWATGFSTDQVFKINPSTGAISATYGVLAGGGPSGITHAGGVLWWVNYNVVGGRFYLSRMYIDGSSLQNFVIDAASPTRLVYDGDSIWVPSTVANGILIKFDPESNTQELAIVMPDAVGDIVFDQNFIWLSIPTARALQTIRPIDGQVLQGIGVNSPSGSGTLNRILFDGHAIWYSMGTDNQVGRYLLPWHDGYANGSVFDGISLYNNTLGTYTCIQSDGAGGIITSLGLCP